MLVHSPSAKEHLAEGRTETQSILIGAHQNKTPKELLATAKGFLPHRLVYSPKRALSYHSYLFVAVHVRRPGFTSRRGCPVNIDQSQFILPAGKFELQIQNLNTNAPSRAHLDTMSQECVKCTVQLNLNEVRRRVPARYFNQRPISLSFLPPFSLLPSLSLPVAALGGWLRLSHPP